MGLRGGNTERINFKASSRDIFALLNRFDLSLNLVGENNDSEIVEGLRNRRPEALAAAYDRYGHIAFALFIRITKDRTLAEDLVQELFLRVWNRVRSFDSGKGMLGSWILSIARNMAIDHVRSAHAKFNKRLSSMDSLEHAGFAYGQRQQESFLTNIQAIREAFGDLTENERRVVELAYFEGLSQTEIASHLDKPLGTVKSWMRSALSRLRVVVRGEVLR